MKFDITCDLGESRDCLLVNNEVKFRDQGRCSLTVADVKFDVDSHIEEKSFFP